MVEGGTPLFDWLESRDTVWVYYPKSRYEGGWVCDLMVLNRGDVMDCRANLKFSDRFLSSLCEECPPR